MWSACATGRRHSRALEPARRQDRRRGPAGALGADRDDVVAARAALRGDPQRHALAGRVALALGRAHDLALARDRDLHVARLVEAEGCEQRALLLAAEHGPVEPEGADEVRAGVGPLERRPDREAAVLALHGDPAQVGAAVRELRPEAHDVVAAAHPAGLPGERPLARAERLHALELRDRAALRLAEDVHAHGAPALAAEAQAQALAGAPGPDAAEAGDGRAALAPLAGRGGGGEHRLARRARAALRRRRGGQRDLVDVDRVAAGGADVEIACGAPVSERA